MHIRDVFRRTVARFPERVAAVDSTAGTRYTYGEWDERVRAVAGSLQQAGVRESDRVGAVMGNRIELATLFWATQLVGATFVPLHFQSSPEELSYLIDNATPAILFVSGDVVDAVDRARDDVTSLHHVICVDDAVPSFAIPYETILDGSDDAFEPTAEGRREDTALILHTSGTMGRLKGARRTHENTHAAASAHAMQFSWQQGERTLGHVPLSHTMGTHTLVATALMSGTWVTLRDFSAAALFSLVEAERLTSLYLTPTVYHDLVYSEAVEDADLSSVRSVAYAAADMPRETLERTIDCFEPEVIVNHYGSTEVYTHSVCSWVDEKPGCAGRAGMNTALRLVEPESDDMTATVPRGAFGEILVDATSPEAFDGYLDRRVSTDVVKDGWFFTGDLGYLDADGDLFVVGRVDNMINSGGENIYPVEVESILEEHEAIAECAVVGHQNDRLSQTVTAFVNPVGDVETVDFEALAETLDGHCRSSDRLADFKRPRAYYFTDEIVKSNVGKILRRELMQEELDIDILARVSL